MDQVSIDFETRSTVELKHAGAHIYAASPSTAIMCMAWSVNQGGVFLWWPGQPFPPEVADAIRRGANVNAWNAAFERLIWPVMERQHGAPPVPMEQWRCTMVRALLCGFPGQLDHAGPSMGLGTVKDKTGHSLMLRVSKPRTVYRKGDHQYKEALDEAVAQQGRPLPEYTQFEEMGKLCAARWWVDTDRMKKLGEYCRQDVVVEEAAANFLEPIPERELRWWRMDQRINDRGFYIDLELVHKARLLVKPATQIANDALRQVTGKELKSVTKPNEVRAWLNNRLGLELDSIDKQTLGVLLAEDPRLAGDAPQDPVAKEVIRLRQAGGKTSTAKLNSLVRGTGPDGIFRGGLQFAGAGRTARYAGRRFQAQNLPRPASWAEEAVPYVQGNDLEAISILFDTPLEVISSILRSCIIARPGHELTVADYNAIEVRVAAWLAGCAKLLDAYRTGKDPYRVMAASIFGYSDWRDVPKGGMERFLGKTCVLGAQYGTGKKKFWQSCRDQGVFIDFSLAELAIDVYRKDNWEIPAMWRALDGAALHAMHNPYTWVECLQGKAHFFRDDNYLRMRLPSGRCLFYLSPRIIQDVTPWGTETYKIQFWGWEGMRNRMEWQSLWGGVLANNLTQATSRDLLLEAMERLDKEGWSIILSVHDELLTDNPIGERTAQELEAEMAKPPEWAADLPLKVEGWTGHRYRK